MLDTYSGHAINDGLITNKIDLMLTCSLCSLSALDGWEGAGGVVAPRS